MVKKPGLPGGNLYRQLLITFLILGAVLVLFMLTVVGIGVERRTIDLFFDKDAELLEQIAYGSLFVDNFAKTFAMSLLTDNVPERLLGPVDPDLWETVNLVNRIKAKVNALTVIHSVYIYNKDLGKLYSTSGKARQEIGETQDLDLRDMILEGEVPGRLMAIPRTIPQVEGLSYQTGGNVLTYVLPVHYYEGEEFPSALIVNLKADFLMETIDRFSREAAATVIVFDDQRRIIGHENPAFYRQALSREYLGILDRLETSSRGTARLGGSRVLASLFHLPDTGWYFLKTTPYAEVAGPLWVQRLLLAAIAAVFLVIAGLLSVLLSRRLYRPIQGLVRHVERLAPPAEGLNRDELEFVSAAFSEAVEKVRSLSALRGESIKSVETQAVREAFLGAPRGIEGLRSLLGRYGAETEPRYRIMLLRLDTGESTDAGKEVGSTLLGKLRPVVFGDDDVVTQTVDGIGFSITNDEGDVAAFGATDAILEGIRSSHENGITDLSAWSVSTAYSSGSGNLGDVPRLYQEVLDLIEYRFVFGPGSAMRLEDVEERVDDSVPFPTGEERAMIDALREGRIDESKAEYAGISAIVSRYSYDGIRMGLARVASSIFEFLNSSAAIPPRDPRFRYLDFMAHLGACRYLTAADDLMIGLIESVGEALRENVGDKTMGKVRAAREHVHTSYADPGVNLAMTASMLNMSAVYLGRIFKKATDLSFNAYLTKVRLEEAARRLRETGDKVETIAAEVGIGNTRFFFTKFKEVYGRTPAGYRSSGVHNGEGSG